MIIALTGAPQVGKDTFANFFLSENVVQYAFARPIKEMLCAAFGWKMEDFETPWKDQLDPFWKVVPREMMEYIGTGIMRRDLPSKFPTFDQYIGELIWVKRFEKFYLENKYKTIIITDLRYDPEFYFLSSLEYYNILITRNGTDLTRMYDIKKHSHDFELDNNSTIEDFKKKAKELYYSITGDN